MSDHSDWPSGMGQPSPSEAEMFPERYPGCPLGQACPRMPAPRGCRYFQLHSDRWSCLYNEYKQVREEARRKREEEARAEARRNYDPIARSLGR